MASPEFTQTILIKADPATVWQAIVDPGLVVRYHLAPLKAIRLRIGGDIVYGTKDEDMIVGKITYIDPTTRLDHTFRFHSGHQAADQDHEAAVSYRLAKTAEGTALTILHFGFEEENQTYANISEGWPVILKGLKETAEATQ